MRRLGSGLVSALLALALVGCAGDPVPAETPEPGGPSATPTTSPTEPSADPEPDGLPGEPFDSGPPAGAQLGVVGVEASDVLNLRSGPGVDFDVVAGLAPLEADVIATGRSRLIDVMSSIWVEADVDGVTGWANSRYLAYLGQVGDITSRLGTPAGGSELTDVAEAVVDQWVGEGEGSEFRPTVTVVDGPHHGDLGEITVDLLGVGDDSVLGTRLHIFATPDGGRFTARTVEATVLCARGVVDGLCI